MENNNAHTIKLLANTVMFGEFSRADLKKIAQYTKYETFEKDSIVFDVGGEHNHLYIIEQGEILVQKQDNANDLRVAASFIQGESFGEVELFSKKSFPFRAIASERCRLLLFPADEAQADEMRLTHPQVFSQVLQRLIKIVGGRVRSTNQIISENSRWIQTLREHIFVDKLTGLYNRNVTSDVLCRNIFNNETVAILMVKPDNFKEINDTCGHEIGDSVLRLFASTLISAVEKVGISIRYRSNEFASIIPNLEKEKMRAYAQTLHKKMSKIDLTSLLGEHAGKISVSFSVGAAEYPQDGHDIEELMRIANEQVYIARNSGGNKIQIYENQ